MVAAVALAAFTPTSYASAPNPTSAPTGQPQGSKTQQDPQWLKAKFSYRVFSGIVPGQGKGAHTHPSILTTPFYSPSAKNAPYTGAPSSYSLTIGGDQYTAEPGDGRSPHYNFGPNENNWHFTYDDAYSHYSDIDMVQLCGPGAADVATYYWPNPTNFGNYANVTDSLDGNVATSWNGTDVDSITRMRGYMVHMAFAIKPPTWTKYGMLPQTYVQTGEAGGTTLQVVRDALNWEASGEDLSNWSSYFYANDWNSNYTSESAVASALHSDIVSDLYYNNVPVIVEVDTSFLPNWSTYTKHFVAIIGYNDVAGQYTYLDTCKVYTGCNGDSISKDAEYPHPISQHDLAEGVWNIPTNKTQGDGGWVW